MFARDVDAAGGAGHREASAARRVADNSTAIVCAATRALSCDRSRPVPTPWDDPLEGGPPVARILDASLSFSGIAGVANHDVSALGSTTVEGSLAEHASQIPAGRWADSADLSAGTVSYPAAPEQTPATPRVRRKRFGGVSFGSSAVMPLGEREPSLAVRMGAVTMRKVVEMEKMLLEELETSLVLKAGFLSSCLHSWRRQVALQCARRSHDIELHRVRLAFERHLTHLDVTFREDLQLTLRERRHRAREAAELVVLRWQEGRARGCLHEAVYLWAKTAGRERFFRLLLSHTGAASGVVGRLAAGSRAAMMRATFQAWAMLFVHAWRFRRHRGRVSLALQRCFGDEAMLSLRSSVQAWRARAERVATWRARLATGCARGLCIVALSGWKEACRLLIAARLGQHVLARSVGRFAMGNARCLLRAAFAGLAYERHSEATHRHHENALLAAVAGESARVDARGRELLSAEAERRLAAKSAVRLAVGKSVLGKTQGLLHEVCWSWHRHSHQRVSSARARARVARAALQWVERDRRGLLHSCFLAWQHKSVVAARERRKEAELQEHRHAFDAQMAQERKRSEELANRIRALEWRAEESAQKVQRAMQRKGVQLQKMLLLQVLKGWIGYVEIRKRLAARSGAVCTALCVTIEGKARGEVRGVLLSWQAFASQARKQHKQRSVAKAMVSRWVLGESLGLLAGVVAEWRHASRKARELKRERRRRRLEAGLALVRESLRSWARYAAAMSARREMEVSLAHNQRRRRLEEAQRLIFFSSLLGSQTHRVALATVVAAWITMMQAQRADVAARRLGSLLQEQVKINGAWAVRLKDAKLMAFEHVCDSSSRFHGFLCFYAWSRAWLEERQQRVHHCLLRDAADQLSCFTLRQRGKCDVAAFLQACLHQWRSAAVAQRHHHEVTRHVHAAREQQQQLEATDAHNADLKDELQHTYWRMDQLAETLQKELQSKEDLAAELRESYRARFVEPASRSCGATSPASVPTPRPGGGQWGDALRASIAIPWQGSPGASPGTTPAATRRPLSAPRMSSAGLLASFEVKERGGFGDASTRGVSTATCGSRSELSPSWDAPPLGELRAGYLTYNGPVVTPECDWDAALARMQDEGLVGRRRRHGEGDGSSP